MIVTDSTLTLHPAMHHTEHSYDPLKHRHAVRPQRHSVITAAGEQLERTGG